ADDTRHHVDRLVERLAIEHPDLLARQHRSADNRLPLLAAHHHDLAHIEHERRLRTRAARTVHCWIGRPFRLLTWLGRYARRVTENTKRADEHNRPQKRRGAIGATDQMASPLVSVRSQKMYLIASCTTRGSSALMIVPKLAAPATTAGAPK